jgi:hypothetical protein
MNDDDVVREYLATAPRAERLAAEWHALSDRERDQFGSLAAFGRYKKALDEGRIRICRGGAA